MKFLPIPPIVLALFAVSLSGCSKSEGRSVEESHGHEQRKIIVTSPEVKDVISTEQYVCQIHSRRHIEVCALESGYLEQIPVQEGQAVKQGDLMFKILPSLYQAKFESEAAEAQLAQIEFNNTKNLFQRHVVSDQEVALANAKLAKAQAQVQLAQTELNFTDIKAPFDGIIDRLHAQMGSLIEEGEMLTSLSDNGVMWVYFNVPEARYLEYRSGLHQNQGQSDEVNKVQDIKDLQIELVLADGNKFNQTGKIGAIEADFNNETGNIAFRADFPNPDNLLRHGQTGSVLIHRVVHDAIVIPQRATFEILDKQYVYLVGKDNAVHQQEISVQHEMEDIYVIEKGVKEGDKIVLEGVREVRDGAVVDFEFRAPDAVLSELKNKAE